MYFFSIFMWDLDHLTVLRTTLSKEEYAEILSRCKAYPQSEDDETPVIPCTSADGEPRHNLDALESITDGKLYLTASAALGAGIRFQKKLKMRVRNSNRAMHSKKKRKKREYNII